MDDDRRAPGRFAYAGLERTVHERARLGILAALHAHGGGLLFTEIRELCSLTDGNLNRHVKVLGDAGLVQVWKGSEGHRSQTMFRLTDAGRTRFREYLDELQRVLDDARA